MVLATAQFRLDKNESCSKCSDSLSVEQKLNHVFNNNLLNVLILCLREDLLQMARHLLKHLLYTLFQDEIKFIQYKSGGACVSVCPRCAQLLL